MAELESNPSADIRGSPLVQSIVFVCFTIVVVAVLPVIDKMLWSEKMLDMISVFLNLLRLNLWSKM